ncbi:2-oxoglutarate (2OG) and Fe(II)-dependent oxygenase superfamily protein [Melia azedarach]|uniref:2-oxoglutarate (2OG) and Fe(II)-dependent oxygenase superfamily protein n=1 Tax=Melia azedarach TaxID=155640 RepID=A0ACC1YKD8_MELAZ|nr:2-oxoglutarate (2OG) and Fe(II)-dependent oxygenase superfamily protein [Melia azedarach]
MADQNEAPVVLHSVDLSNPDIRESAAILKQACMDTGIFYVINHGISEELMAEVFAQSKKFFALPLEEKMKNMVTKSRGYKVINKLYDQETKQQAHGEGFALIEEAPDANNDHRPLRGPNVWPSAELLPGWKETVVKYQKEVLKVASAVSRIIAIALDLNEDFFDQPQFLGNAIPYLSLIHYEVEGAQPLKECLLGTPPHTDPSLITLLATDEVPGLQICRDLEGKPRVWKDVAPLEGAFIVNIGDILERMSNCIFRSTFHRVQYRKDRYTVAFFVYPSLEGTIECIPSCVSAENPPKYPPIKNEELLGTIFKTEVAAA